MWTAAGYEAGQYSLERLAERGIRQLWLAPEAHNDWPGESYVPRPIPGQRLSVTIPAGAEILSMFRLKALDLFHELARFVEATGELFVQSPSVTSDVILRHAHQGKGCRPVERTVEPAPARKIERRSPEGAEGDLVWWANVDSVVRPPYRGSGRYVHHFDLNASYLGATSGLALPQGQPVYTQRPVLGRRTPPGYWLVSMPLISPPGWPPIARNRGMRFGSDRAWVTTPTLELAATLGPVEVIEGWYWNDHCQGLRPWYETLRRAREQLLTGPAYEAVKWIYKTGIGRLGSTRRSREDDPLYQPTWRHLVIAEARGRVWRRIAKAPVPPIAIQVDGAWWVTDIADPVEAAGWLGLPLDPIRLGCWKHQGTGDGAAAIAALGERDPISVLRGLTGA